MPPHPRLRLPRSYSLISLAFDYTVPSPAFKILKEMTQSHGDNEAHNFPTTIWEKSVHADSTITLALPPVSSSLPSPSLSVRCNTCDSAPLFSQHHSPTRPNLDKKRPTAVQCPRSRLRICGQWQVAPSLSGILRGGGRARPDCLYFSAPSLIKGLGLMSTASIASIS